jgi:hypothetical protein
MASIGRSWLPDVVTVDVASTVYRAAILHPGQIPWQGGPLHRFERRIAKIQGEQTPLLKGINLNLKSQKA